MNYSQPKISATNTQAAGTPDPVTSINESNDNTASQRSIDSKTYDDIKEKLLKEDKGIGLYASSVNLNRPVEEEEAMITAADHDDMKPNELRRSLNLKIDTESSSKPPQPELIADSPKQKIKGQNDNQNDVSQTNISNDFRASDDSFMTAKESLSSNQKQNLQSALLLSKKQSQPSKSPRSRSKVDGTDDTYYQDAHDDPDSSMNKMKIVFDRSIDMSLLEDDRGQSDSTSQKPVDQSKYLDQSHRILKPIQEMDDEDKDVNTRNERSSNQLSDSQASATFPGLPNLPKERSISQELVDRESFRPPFDPKQQQYQRDRKDTDNFTFSKKDTEIKRYMQSAENPFQSLMKANDQVIAIEEVESGETQHMLQTARKQQISDQASENSRGQASVTDSRDHLRHPSAGASTGMYRSRVVAGTSGVLSNASLDYTYNSQRRAILNKRKSRATSGGHTLEDEKNILLEDNTLPYLFSDGGKHLDPNDSMSSDTITNASLVFETHHTRWFHRCFKCNIALNIAMLITFILIILLAPWYKIQYVPEDHPTKHLTAIFSLLLISFTTKDTDTQKKYYYRIFSVSFFNVCKQCGNGKIDPEYIDDCAQVESFCDDTSETLTNIFLYILFLCGILAIILHAYAIICGVGIITKHKIKCCRLSFPLRNIFIIHLVLASTVFVTLCLWVFGTTGKVNDYEFDFGNAMWTYFGLVLAQFLLRMHFKYYNSHLKRIRSLQYVNSGV